jgi:2-polyprenyl-3-methyl-5-hydroxy-6-metoxy-1,4-benzoquinol methylase
LPLFPQYDVVMQTHVADFWDTVYATSSYSHGVDTAVLDAALAHFGDVRGKSVVEIGCGPGSSALYLASKGANVVALDVSRTAIEELNAHCARHAITNVRGVCANAMAINALEPADFVFGSMILHHIEPFGPFAASLRRLVKPGGKAFFYENSAVSRVLVWFRQHVVGKLWVPKYGDADEFPLTHEEVRELRRHFAVRIEHPEMLFFALAGQYLLRGHFVQPLRAVDRFFYRRRWLLQYSYRQFVMLSKEDSPGPV